MLKGINLNDFDRDIGEYLVWRYEIMDLLEDSLLRSIPRQWQLMFDQDAYDEENEERSFVRALCEFGQYDRSEPRRKRTKKRLRVGPPRRRK